MRSSCLALVAGFLGCVGCANTSGEASDSTAQDASAGIDARVDAGSGATCTFDEYSSPGSDDVWGTADDVGQAVSVYRFGPQKLLQSMTQYAPGKDLKLGTADDEPTFHWRFTYDASGALQETAGYSAPGGDGAWDTADDVQASLEHYQYDAQGRRVEQLNYSDAGTDKIWGSQDDVPSSRATFGEFQSDGRAAKEVRYDGPGADGKWSTSDDKIAALVRTVFQTGVAAVATVYTSAGPDGAWETKDDVVGSMAASTCDKNTRTLKVYTGPGPDGAWSTGDDQLGSQHRLAGDPGCPLNICVWLQ
jgi:YD repeat-containing protein